MPTGPTLLDRRRAACRVAVLALAAAALACAARRGPDDAPRPDGSGWVSPLHRDHPLVGKIWDVRAGAFVTQADLDAAATRARFLLLGETHDNPDHHLGQARLVRLVGAQRHPGLVFEMLDVDQQPKIDAAIASSRDPLALARAVAWDESGWPPFGLYRPVFEAGLAAGMPIVGGSLPRTQARAVFKSGPSALPEPVRVRLERVGPFPPDVLRVLKAEMAASHCGELPDSMVEPMVSIQKAKDAQLAERLVASDRGAGAILVAGRGHVRNDVGVPLFLKGDASAKEILSVGFVEVSPSRERPDDYRAEYGEGPLPLDYLVFTPGIEREDPCAGFHEQQQRLRREDSRQKPPAKPEHPDEGTQL